MLANSTKPTLLLIGNAQSTNITEILSKTTPVQQLVPNVGCCLIGDCAVNTWKTILFEVPDQFTADPTIVRDFCTVL